MTTVAVSTFTHSVTYVADNILKSLKDIIRLSGLDPSHLADSWGTIMLALKTWLHTHDLKGVVLEIYDPKTDALAVRWDIDIVYGSTTGDGSFWTDTEQLKCAIRKAGLAPNSAAYRVVLETEDGRPDVPGWIRTKFRSTSGMVRQSLGTTIEHNGLGANAAYWRRT